MERHPVPAFRHDDHGVVHRRAVPEEDRRRDDRRREPAVVLPHDRLEPAQPDDPGWRLVERRSTVGVRGVLVEVDAGLQLLAERRGKLLRNGDQRRAHVEGEREARHGGSVRGPSTVGAVTFATSGDDDLRSRCHELPGRRAMARERRPLERRLE